jgi:hypothetical protein
MSVAVIDGAAITVSGYAGGGDAPGKPMFYNMA